MANDSDASDDDTRGGLERVGDGVWTLPGEVRLLPGAYLPARATVLRLDDGSLWVHSPVRLTEAAARQLEAEGPVSHLVAPNNLHHLFIGAWKDRFPRARMVGARGLLKKRADLHFDATLDEESRWPGVEGCYLDGAPVWGETVFWHPASKTLLCCDLFFNLGPHNTRGAITPWMLRLAGAWRKPMQSRLVRVAVKDRAKAGASVEKVLEWPFERVIMAHGEIIEDNAHEAVRAACHWMLKARKKEAGQLAA